MTLTYVYDDAEHPDRPTSAIQSPAWTPEDRALLRGLEVHESDRCACDWPRSLAWHSEMDGFFEAQSYVCHACSARDGRQIAYSITQNTRPESKGPMPLFELGITTTEPDPPQTGGARA